MDIRIIHKNIFQYLYNYSRENSMLFMPRIYNTKGRLENGFYFIGDNNYLQVSFWDSRDWKEKIHNISFVVLKNGDSYVEISGKDSKEKAVFLSKLVIKLNELSKLTFQEIYENKWTAHYESNNYIENLESFIMLEKLIIDEFILLEENSPIDFINESKFDKIVSKIIELNPLLRLNPNNEVKKTSVIKASEYRMSLFHQKLQRDIYSFLKASSRYKDIELEKNYIDITGYKINGETEYYEVKPFIPRIAIREAIGQLLEYAHYPSVKKADKMIIASHIEPKVEDINYIKYIRKNYNMEIYYVYYDYNLETLSKEY